MNHLVDAARASLLRDPVRFVSHRDDTGELLLPGRETYATMSRLGFASELSNLYAMSSRVPAGSQNGVA